jgi:protein-glutamine gamma-glutamyltransferase
MIRIAHNNSVDPSSLARQLNLDHVGTKILLSMAQSSKTYDFEYMEQLHFELVFRSNIVKASYELNDSGVDFASFRTSHCNPRYWDLSDNGGFLLRDEVLPSTGIRDIFHNGHHYGFECATAMIIVLYKAMLDTIPKDTFNRLFGGLFLRDGHHDRHLPLKSIHDFGSLRGDILYFRNPEVDPDESEWRGENTVDLGNGTYFGHGIGITTSHGIIHHLNEHRIPDATESAYLSDHILRPDYKRLASLDGSIPAMALRTIGDYTGNIYPFKDLVVAQIGRMTYLLA